MNRQILLFLLHLLILAPLTAHTAKTPEPDPALMFQQQMHTADTYFEQRNLEQALSYYKQALAIRPQSINCLLKIAHILETQKKFQEAIAYYKNATDLAPTLTYGYLKLAKLHHEAQDYRNALHYYQKVDVLKPNDTTIISKIASTQCALGQCKQAAKNYLRVLKIEPDNISAMYNTGYSLKVLGAIDMAIELYDKVLAIKPDHQMAWYAKALAYLYKGDFKHGWPLYAQRLIQENRNAPHLRSYITQNQLAGKVIFLAPEGGFGDTIQFIRYAQILHDAGAIVVVAERKPLLPLLSHCPYIDKLIPTGQRPSHYDDYASIMSLPAIFESQEQEIPKNIPYLFPNKTLEKKWQNYFANKKETCNIGLCWIADLKNDVSRLPCAHRSINLEKLEKLSHIPNITFYSLQKDITPEQINASNTNLHIHTFGPTFDREAGAFMDTAAIMKQLDLVITVDTSIAHLAGALGVPVWLLLPYNTDWRWIARRTDSPWYPTMKIFKQTQAFNWDGVIERVYHALEKCVNLQT